MLFLVFSGWLAGVRQGSVSAERVSLSVSGIPSFVATPPSSVCDSRRETNEAKIRHKLCPPLFSLFSTSFSFFPAMTTAEAAAAATGARTCGGGQRQQGARRENFPLGEQRVPAAVGFVRGAKVFAISHVLDNVPKIRSSSSQRGSLRLPFMFLAASY